MTRKSVKEVVDKSCPKACSQRGSGMQTNGFAKPATDDQALTRKSVKEVVDKSCPKTCSQRGSGMQTNGFAKHARQQSEPGKGRKKTWHTQAASRRGRRSDAVQALMHGSKPSSKILTY